MDCGHFEWFPSKKNTTGILGRYDLSWPLFFSHILQIQDHHRHWHGRWISFSFLSQCREFRKLQWWRSERGVVIPLRFGWWPSLVSISDLLDGCRWCPTWYLMALDLWCGIYFVAWIVRSFVRSFVCSFVCLFVRLFVCLFVCLFV